MLEMHVQGVSTRKVTKVMEELCAQSYSKSFVSSLTKQLDEDVNIWRNRDISIIKYPYLLVDIAYIKVRENRRVVSKACHIAIGISEKCKREILGLDISQGETINSWSNFFEYLKKRGISGLKMVISDSHKGLVRAIKESFTNVSWQRCQAHFIRNILERSPKKNTEEFRADVNALFKIKDINLARKVKDEIFNKYEKNLITPEISQLEEELERVNRKKKFHKNLKSTIYGLITVAALAVLVATLWLPILKIYGTSMTPALHEGDIVISLKNKHYSSGDIVGLYYGNKLLVKRVIAGPGDMVDFDYERNVYVNDKMLEEKYLEEKAYGDITIRLPYQVPEKRCFVLGDHRSTSIDSRNQVIGAVSEEQIVG